jgi:serine/threonine protein kinase
MKKVSTLLKELIKKILVKPNERLTLKQIFEHPWMTAKLEKEPLKINFTKMSNFSKFSKVFELQI